MADPISILGTAGAVANIIDVLGKVITTFAELRSQWQEADLAVLALESELAALNAALTKIKEWAESYSDDPHYQLTMDLDRCVVCCRLLIGKIDAEISKFQKTTENQLDAASKFRLLLKTKDFEHIQQMIGRQTAAVNLLLTACNTTMLSKQKGLLEESTTRRIFKKMEDDTASLLVHRDVDSLLAGTATSIRSSKRSIVFDFDSTLFLSRIYQRWIRGSVKKALLEQQNDKSAMPVSNGRFRLSSTFDMAGGFDARWDRKLLEQRSQEIDHDIMRDEKLLKRQVQILVLGDRSRADIIYSMVLNDPSSWPGDLGLRSKPIVLALVFRCVKALADAMRKHQVAPDIDEIWEHITYIESAEFETTCRNPSGSLDPGFIAAAASIMNSSYFSIDRCDEFDLPMSTEHFLVQLATIAAPDYCPSRADAVRRAECRPNGDLWEAELAMGWRNIHLFDPNGYKRRNEMNRWIHFCEVFLSRRKLKKKRGQFALAPALNFCPGAALILFVIDLDTYDHVNLSQTNNHLWETLLFYETIVNSKMLARSSVLLIFDKLDVFTRKLSRAPLENYFPDFTGSVGGNAAKAALEFLRS
ncbi:G-protein alpha subunit-domain-containing protein [Rhypophila decipiens]|uniref:G-protein alpha subunit-domain-containing protein n=1 Tax=Rhypophila decipiens TaxID=261697 RepID=A0AAN6Y5K4_9PEZI|nr:G-protein alpha subunit-domain-containing protein [Rhypophila decipiens]